MREILIKSVCQSGANCRAPCRRDAKAHTLRCCSQLRAWPARQTRWPGPGCCRALPSPRAAPARHRCSTAGTRARGECLTPAVRGPAPRAWRAYRHRLGVKTFPVQPDEGGVAIDRHRLRPITHMDSVYIGIGVVHRRAGRLTTIFLGFRPTGQEELRLTRFGCEGER